MTKNPKKTLLLLLGIILVALLVFSVMKAPESPSASTTSPVTGTDVQEVSGNKDLTASMSNEGTITDFSDIELENVEELDTRPATEIYTNAQEALAAIQAGAEEYDDIILEQFSLLGEDCAFCDSLYQQVISLMLKPDANEDEKAYYSEVLAISGRPENIETLINSIREASNEDDADIFAESLELALGDDKVVKLLANFLEDKNELLQESSIAAITNQGSKFAAQTLYEHTVSRKETDGYYDLGIGLGEMIPDEATLPYLQELVLKRDEYSHLAVKSLLNYGNDGVVLVFDALTNSSDPEKDKKMLVDAIDHVGYEEATMNFLKDVLADNPAPLVAQFAQDILAGFDPEEDDE